MRCALAGGVASARVAELCACVRLRFPQDNSATWRALVKTLTQLTTEKTLVLIAHTWRGPEKAFFLMLPKAGFTISQVDRAHLHPMFQRAGCPTRLLALHRHPTPTGGGAGGSSAEAEGGILGAPAAGGGEQDA